MSTKNIRYKESNENSRTKKYSNQNQNTSGWGEHLNREDRRKNY